MCPPPIPPPQVATHPATPPPPPPPATTPPRHHHHPTTTPPPCRLQLDLDDIILSEGEVDMVDDWAADQDLQYQAYFDTPQVAAVLAAAPVGFYRCLKRAIKVGDGGAGEGGA